jgi:hypothetical protein
MENFVAAIFERDGAVSVDPEVNLHINGIHHKMVRWMCQVPEHVNEHLYINAVIESMQKRVLYYSQIAYNPELRILICHVFYE